MRKRCWQNSSRTARYPTSLPTCNKLGECECHSTEAHQSLSYFRCTGAAEAGSWEQAASVHPQLQCSHLMQYNFHLSAMIIKQSPNHDRLKLPTWIFAQHQEQQHLYASFCGWSRIRSCANSRRSAKYFKLLTQCPVKHHLPHLVKPEQCVCNTNLVQPLGLYAKIKLYILSNSELEG